MSSSMCFIAHDECVDDSSELRRFISTIVSMTTDFCTDASIASIEPLPLENIYPPACPMHFEDEQVPVDRDHHVEHLDFRSVIFVPDALHILHNLTSDMLDRLCISVLMLLVCVAESLSQAVGVQLILCLVIVCSFAPTVCFGNRQGHLAWQASGCMS